AALLPREIYDRVYRGGPDTVLAGVTQPVGTAEGTEGGWRGEGGGAFARGWLHAGWVGGGFVFSVGGQSLSGPGGKGPLMRGFFMPASDWQIEDTWQVAGLGATASHHIVFRDKIVPADQFFDFANGAPCLPGPLYQTVREVLPLFHAAFAVGLARG